MSRRIFRGLASPLALVFGFLSLGACQPEPTPGTVDLVGDSISLQAMLAGGGLGAQPGDLETHVGLGWTAADVLPWVQHQVASGRPETLVVALGVNDASLRNGGWTWGDIAVWVDLLDAPHPEACVVVVLPAVGDGASPELHTEVAEARDSMTHIAERRAGPTVVTDWGIVVDADPAVLAGDGVHLAEGDGPYGIDPYAAEAATSLYWQGVEQCR